MRRIWRGPLLQRLPATAAGLFFFVAALVVARRVHPSVQPSEFFDFFLAGTADAGRGCSQCSRRASHSCCTPQGPGDTQCVRALHCLIRILFSARCKGRLSEKRTPSTQHSASLKRRPSRRTPCPAAAVLPCLSRRSWGKGCTRSSSNPRRWAGACSEAASSRHLAGSWEDGWPAETDLGCSPCASLLEQAGGARHRGTQRAVVRQAVVTADGDWLVGSWAGLEGPAELKGPSLVRRFAAEGAIPCRCSGPGLTLQCARLSAWPAPHLLVC